MHGCPCGYFGDSLRQCTCSDAVIRRYRRRLSGPLLDRIDIHLEVPRVAYEKLAVPSTAAATREPSRDRITAAGGGEASADVRSRVIAARERQRTRLAGTGLAGNAEMGPAEVRRHCATEPAAEALLRAAMQRLHLFARAYHRVLKLARTIADLAGAETIGAAPVAEALQYRPRQEEL